MGQTLSEPVTTKNTAFCQNKQFRVGSSCMQGWRVNMEDSHTHILSLPDDPTAAFFAVFDGHGGTRVSEYAGKHLHHFITNRLEYRQGNIEAAMKEAFLDIDRAMWEDENVRSDESGSTAVAIIIKDNILYCANAGDSRAVASIGGRVEPLSRDHKPNDEDEQSRILAAGGFVDFDRVNGNLALSRALGDYVFKRNEHKNACEQIVIACPEVKIFEINSDWEFVVLACDGIWDVMNNEEVISYVRDNIAAGVEPEEICENIMMVCLAPDVKLAGLGCDNMTLIIVAFLHDSTYENLSLKCSNSKNCLSLGIVK